MTTAPPEVLDWPLRAYSRPFQLLFYFTWSIALVSFVSGHWTSSVGAALVSVAALTALVGLGGGLPIQNVVGLAVVIGGLTMAVESIAVHTGFPFGRFEYGPGSGSLLPGGVPWPILPGWIAAIVASRGAASQLLRSWRGRRGVGFAIMGLAASLVAVLDLGLQWSQAGRGTVWNWQTSSDTLMAAGVPWMRPIGVACVAVVVLAVAFPLWINKRPFSAPPDSDASILWLLLHGFVAITNGLAGRWWAVAVAGVAVVGLGAIVQTFRTLAPGVHAKLPKTPS